MSTLQIRTTATQLLGIGCNGLSSPLRPPDLNLYRFASIVFYAVGNHLRATQSPLSLAHSQSVEIYVQRLVQARRVPCPATPALDQVRSLSRVRSHWQTAQDTPRTRLVSSAMATGWNLLLHIQYSAARAR
jgi:hypothetical protein